MAQAARMPITCTHSQTGCRERGWFLHPVSLLVPVATLVITVDSPDLPMPDKLPHQRKAVVAKRFMLWRLSQRKLLNRVPVSQSELLRHLLCPVHGTNLLSPAWYV